MYKLLNYIIYSALILAVYAPSVFSLPAFPGAEGFGSQTPGGRGGKVIAVTNLNDSGPGSLRAALTASGPRIVVFRVAGTIELMSRIELTEPFLTVAGQTAPGDGITITRHASMEEKGLMAIRTHDVVMRFLRVRNLPPSGDNGGVDTVTMYSGSYNVVIDHCTFSWGVDEVFQTGEGAHDLTIQWSIIAEGLSNSTHPEGEHSKGLHFRGENSGNISMHHNLLAHHMDRSPNINTSGTFDMVNNIFYNGGKFWTFVKDKFGEPKVNAISNYYKRGPSSWSVDGNKGYEIFYYDSTGRKPEIFLRGNIGFHRPTDDLPEELLVEEDSRFMIVNSRFSAPPVTTVSAFQALDLVLNNAGAILPVRDAHDQRIVADVRNGTGRIIDHPSDVGGLLVMASGTPPVDTDGDGMPDKWEEQHGLQPNDPADGKQDRNGDGYTNVEEYLNSLAAGDSVTPATQPTSSEEDEPLAASEENDPLTAPAEDTPLTAPEEDITAPAVSISDPQDESAVSGAVTVSAVAADEESGIAGVQFKLDGKNLGAEVAAAPYSVLWDTTSVTPGNYFLSALARDEAGNEAESSSILVVVDHAVQQSAPSSGAIYISTQGRGSITNNSQCQDISLSFSDEDILAYDIVSGCWSLYFVGSQVGISEDIDGFHIMQDGSILLSLYADTNLPNVGEIARTDIVRFIPSSLGMETAGSFELYFKGAAVGLDIKDDENIDAIGILPDGRLVISTSSDYDVPGVSGEDADLIVFTAASLGEETKGTWDLYFDGSKISDEDVNGVWVNNAGDMYITTKDALSAADFSVDSGDIFKCAPDSTDISAACTYEFAWNGKVNGLPDDAVVNGIHLAP